MASLIPQRIWHVSALALAVGVLLVLVLGQPLPARAAAAYVVTNCSGQGLADAMNTLNGTQGGTISFNCNNVNAAATISITYPGGYNVTANSAYTIDGGHRITFTGLDANRLLLVNASAALTLTNIVLTSGNAGAGYGGCIYNFSGDLRLDNVTVQNCRTADLYQGGAIHNNYGTLTVVGSRILSNTSSYGGGIFSPGTLTILSSTLAYNTATTGAGGALYVDGNASIGSSQIYVNRASGGDGGGIYADNSSNLTIANSLIASNVATNTQFASGGGLYSRGTLVLADSTLSGNLARYGGGMDSEGAALLNNATISGNTATTAGGGLFNAGNTIVNNSTLSGNFAALSGGGIDNNGTLTVTNTTLSGNGASMSGGGLENEQFATVSNTSVSGNSAQNGGGIHNYLNTLTLRNSTLSANEAIQGGAIFNNAAATLVSNATLSGNSATYGGGIFNNGNTTLTNVTLNNRALPTGAAHNLYLSGGVLTLTHTIVNFDVTYGANCLGAGAPKSVSRGHNLANDEFCSLVATGDHQGVLVPILLGGLANHGGPTRTQLPRLGSAAIDGGDNAVCAAAPVNNLDQRGVLRPLDGTGDGIAICDIGAVERRPSDTDLVPWLYLPLIRR